MARGILASALAFAFCSGIAAHASAADSTIQGTGAVVGTVTAGKPFTAAQVYLRNLDKSVTFMVYTAGGAYRAINLLPGSYEATVARRGFASQPQKLSVRAGETITADFALQDADPAPKAGINGPSTVVAYPGRATVLDNDGNVWVTDRGAPNAIVRLDPRSATLRAFPLPEQGGPHGITVDPSGTVWWGENRWPKLGSLDPETGKITHHLMDPREVLGA